MKDAGVAIAAFALLFGLLGCAISPPPTERIGGAAESLRSEVLTGAATAAIGDVVRVDYIGELENGTVFDTSIRSEGKKAGLAKQTYEQLTFTLGSGQMIKGFEDAIVGMREGEVKTVTIPPELAYGQRDDRYIVSFPIQNFESVENIRVGGPIYLASGAIGTVTAISDKDVTVDFNHELAGKTLVFTIKLGRVEKKY